jgi:hypothetical protein
MPIAVASIVLPGRHTFIQNPIRNAIGIVAAMVKTPQGLPLSAFTTISARTARRMIMMESTAIIAAMPVTGPISSFAIWPSDFPSRRMEPNRITKS